MRGRGRNKNPGKERELKFQSFRSLSVSFLCTRNPSAHPTGRERPEVHILTPRSLLRPLQGGGGCGGGFGNFPTAKPQDPPAEGMIKDACRARGSPTSLAGSQGSPVPSAGGARRDQTELLLTRWLARPPSLSPAPPALLVRDQPLCHWLSPSCRSRPQHTRTHAHTLAHTHSTHMAPRTHAAYTVVQTHHTQAHTCFPHTDPHSQACTHSHSHACVCAHSHMPHA